MEEEIALLEEQLASAHADIERLQEQVAEVVARAGKHETEAVDLRRELEAARKAASDAVAEAEARAAAATSRYRDLLLQHEPGLPTDLVAGDSVEAVDEAAERARQTVAQVRQHIEQQAHAIRVPAGAPPRGAPDLGDLSPAEKIRAGLEGR